MKGTTFTPIPFLNGESRGHIVTPEGYSKITLDTKSTTKSLLEEADLSVNYYLPEQKLNIL